MGADTPRDGFPRSKSLIALRQPARNVRAKCSMKLDYGGADRDICRTLACSECAPSHYDYRNSKVQRLRLNRHGLSWASRPQQAILGESNIGGPSRRKRAGVGSALADISDRARLGETGACGRGLTASRSDRISCVGGWLNIRLGWTSPANPMSVPGQKRRF